MHRRIALAVIALASFAKVGHATVAIEDSRKAAADWLRIVDAADYSTSWQLAASTFKRAVSTQAWVQASQSVRSPLGNVKARAEKTVQPATSLPGAPDGQYVVLQFQTAFERKAEALETVTVVLEPDGAWRVTGYFIK